MTVIEKIEARGCGFPWLYEACPQNSAPPSVRVELGCCISCLSLLCVSARPDPDSSGA